ncbi:MAG: PaaI family thioesterase [Eubacterium sp.]|nr:PaaI family thioesterase [Eubacterium sp.]
MKELEKVRSFFSDDKYATDATGIVIEDYDEGYAKVALRLDKRHRNAVGHVMGAVYYTLADFAFAVANNHDTEKPVTVTLSSTIDYLSEVKGDSMYAVAEVLKEGRKICYYRIDIFDDDGCKCAVVMTKGYRVPKE